MPTTTAKSPRLSKAEGAKLSKRQQSRLQTAVDSVTDAASYRDAIAAGKSAQQEHIHSLRANLVGIEAGLAKHPLAKKHAAKKEQISIAKSDLADIVQELNSAKNELAAKLQSKHDVVNALKKELRGDSDEDA